MKYTITLVLFLLLNLVASAQLDLIFQTNTTNENQGDPVEVDVTVENFVDIVNLQFWVYWDSTVLAFDTIVNLNQDIGLDLNGFNYPGNQITVGGVPAIYQDGKIGVSWQDAINTQTLDDGEVLFTIQLDRIGCESTDMTIGDNPPFAEIEVYENFDFSPSGNIGANSEGLAFSACPVMVDCEVTLKLSEEEGVEDEEICVFMTVEDFNEIESFQGGIFFDETVLEFTGFDFLADADFQGVSNSAEGELSFIWVNDNTTLPDGSEVLKLTFDVIAPTGSTSDLIFGNASSTVLEVLSADGFLEVCTMPSTVEVVDMVSVPVELDLNDVTVQNGANICIPLMVDNFISVSNMQFALNWDPNIFTYTGVQNLNSAIGIVDGSHINESPSGDRLNISWTSSTAGGIVVTGEQVLFEACFDVLATCVDEDPIPSMVSIIGNPQIEVSGEVGGAIVPFSFTTSDSDVTISCEMGTSCDNVTIQIAGDIGQVNCLGGSDGSIIASPSGGTSPYQCVWSNAAGNEIQADGSCTISGLTAGTYTVSTTDANDCMGSQSFTISEPTTSIAVTATATDVSCVTSGTITTIVTNAVGNTSYNWSGGLSGANPTNVSNGSYSVVVTDENGCTATTSVDVSSLDEVVVTGSSTNFGCSGGGTITPVYSSGSGNYTYSWSDLLNGPFNLPTRDGLNPGTYTITVTDSMTGCTDSETFVIESNVSQFVVTAGNTTDIGCVSDTGSFNYSVSGGCPTNGSTYTCILDSGAQEDCTGTVSGISVGSHTLEVSDELGNSEILTFSISEEIGTLAIIGSISTIDVECNGEQSGFVEGVNITGGCPSSLGDYTCTIGGVTVDCADISTIMLLANDYTLNVADSKGNEANASFVISESDEVVVTENSVVFGDSCGSSIDVSVTGGDGSYTYGWTYNGSSFNGGSTLTDLCPGDYCLNAMDSNGCLASDVYCVTLSSVVTVADVSVTSIEDNSGFGVSCSDICDGVISGTQTAGGTIESIELIDQNGISTVFQAFPLDGVCAGTYTMTVTDEFGGTYTHDDNLVVTEASIITVEIDEVINEVNSNGQGAISIFVDGGAGGYTYSWSPGDCDGTTCTELSAGDYTVMVLDVNGCDAILTGITLDNETDGNRTCYEGTSVITPNSDGVNDVFVLNCLNDGNLSSYNLGIYDRWGMQVMNTDTYDNLWGGTDMDGNLLTEGGYYWVLTADFDNGDQRIFKGSVTVLRD